MYERMDFVGSYLAPVLDFANHRRPREVAYEATEGDRTRKGDRDSLDEAFERATSYTSRTAPRVIQSCF